MLFYLFFALLVTVLWKLYSSVYKPYVRYKGYIAAF